jgi:hypothetical protein
MATHQSKQQKQTIERVMHEFKKGELTIGSNGPKVKKRKQAIAIALHEAGTSNQESPKANKKNLKKTKAKERKGQTAQAEKEGKAAQDRTMRKATARKKDNGSGSKKTKGELYAQAKRANIKGRSKMSKSELKRALAH